MSKFQKRGVKAPRTTTLGYTVTSEHQLLMTEDGAEIPISSSRTCLINRREMEYANTAEAKAALISDALEKGDGFLYLVWTGTQWSDMFVINLATSSEAMLRSIGYAPEGDGEIVVHGKKWKRA